MTIADENKVPELIEVLDRLGRYRVEIGILDDGKKYDTGISVLGLAIVHEYGLHMTVKDKNGHKKTIDIPERSFMRSSYDNKKNKVFDFERELERVIALELSVDAFFEDLGKFCVGIVQEYLIEEVKSPPNAPATIKQKGSSNPLVDSGRLVDAIDYKVIRE